MRKALVAVVAAALLTVAGCGGGAPDPNAPATIRFMWWGADQRAKVTTAAVRAFEAANPGITVQVEPTTFDGYFDKLATQFAANDAPDVIQLTPDKVLEFAGRGALLDLGSIDTSKIDPRLVQIVKTERGQAGIPAGIGSHVMVANPRLFAEAGVPMPDDTTWTWADYRRIAQEITRKTGKEGVFGSQAFGISSNGLSVWLSQQGKTLWTKDGQIGYEAPDSTGYFQLLKDMSAEGGLPTPELITEELSAPLEQSGIATGRYAMAYADTSQFSSLVKAAGEDLELLRFPSRTGKASDAKMEVRSSMYWIVPARTEHEAAAKKLVDYLVNSPEAGKLLLGDRGVPTNSAVRDAVRAQLDPANAESVAFIEEISPEARDFVPRAPVGGGNLEEILKRQTSDVLFGRATAAEAAQRLIDESRAATHR
ncbi:extracellular solute-binding protein [Actinomycetes bacterium KLBMP 9759]